MNLDDIHFLRPLWLLAIVPALVLCWLQWRRHQQARKWEKYVDPNLLPHLLSHSNTARQWMPILLLATWWLLTCFALAGPTWEKTANPFAEDEGALVIVMKITPTMLSEDMPPTRLERSCQKIHDLLTNRARGKTALIAYAGSSHVVMPFTSDHGLIESMAGELSPKIMPVEGDAAVEAIALAKKQLQQQGGSILWIADDIARDQMEPLTKLINSISLPIQLLAPLQQGSEWNALSETADKLGITAIRITVDDEDVNSLLSSLHFAGSQADDAQAQWVDAGYWLIPAILLLGLCWFRYGWAMASLGGEK